jgi:hypothetical protein
MVLQGNNAIGSTTNEKCIREKKFFLKIYSTACSPSPFKQEA